MMSDVSAFADADELLRNLSRLHTTKLGALRVKRNLSLDTDDVAGWCRTRVVSPDAAITRAGKNWYVTAGDCVITINAYSFTVITAHKKKHRIIRRYQPSDCKETAELFYNTVHTVNAEDYTKEQLNAWADGKTDLEKWNRTLQEHYSVVAIEDGVIAGFGDMDRTGYLDRLFVHRDYQGKGIGSRICRKLENSVDADHFTTHASVTAKPFFEKRGYRVVKEQQAERQGILLTNYRMEKKRVSRR